MRYNMHQINKSRVSLAEEINHLEKFIGLNQLRFNNELHIDCKIQGDVHGKNILPLILVSFVENIFKHGKLSDPNSSIVIELKVEPDIITFSTANEKGQDKSWVKWSWSAKYN